MLDYTVICPVAPSIGSIVVVDPFSTGANLAATVLQWGFKLILVFNEREVTSTSPHVLSQQHNTHHKSTLMIQHDSSNSDSEEALKRTLGALQKQGNPVLAILPGLETGVELARILAERMDTRTNGGKVTDLMRSNKTNMQEILRAAGLKTIRQAWCHSEEDVSAFYTPLFAESSALSGRSGVVEVVVKPNIPCASDTVLSCEGIDAAHYAFHTIHNKVNALGLVNDGALVQEHVRYIEHSLA